MIDSLRPLTDEASARMFDHQVVFTTGKASACEIPRYRAFAARGLNEMASRMKRQQLREVTAVEHKMTVAGASQWRPAGPSRHCRPLTAVSTPLQRRFASIQTVLNCWRQR